MSIFDLMRGYEKPDDPYVNTKDGRLLKRSEVPEGVDFDYVKSPPGSETRVREVFTGMAEGAYDAMGRLMDDEYTEEDAWALAGLPFMKAPFTKRNPNVMSTAGAKPPPDLEASMNKFQELYDDELISMKDYNDLKEAALSGAYQSSDDPFGFLVKHDAAAKAAKKSPTLDDQNALQKQIFDAYDNGFLTLAEHDAVKDAIDAGTFKLGDSVLSFVDSTGKFAKPHYGTPNPNQGKFEALAQMYDDGKITFSEKLDIQQDIVDGKVTGTVSHYAYNKKHDLVDIDDVDLDDSVLDNLDFEPDDVNFTPTVNAPAYVPSRGNRDLSRDVVRKIEGGEGHRVSEGDMVYADQPFLSEIYPKSMERGDRRDRAHAQNYPLDLPGRYMYHGLGSTPSKPGGIHGFKGYSYSDTDTMNPGDLDQDLLTNWNSSFLGENPRFASKWTEDRSKVAEVYPLVHNLPENEIFDVARDYRVFEGRQNRWGGDLLTSGMKNRGAWDDIEDKELFQELLAEGYGAARVAEKPIGLKHPLNREEMWGGGRRPSSYGMPPSMNIALFDPRRVRSIFGRFDPDLRHLRYLGSAFGGAALLNMDLEGLSGDIEQYMDENR